MTQIEQQLNRKFEKILKEIRTNRERNLINDEADAENNKPSTSTSENEHPRRKHTSNSEIDKDRNQDNRYQSSEMYEMMHPSTPFGVANKTLEDTIIIIIINENRQEANYHRGHPRNRTSQTRRSLSTGIFSATRLLQTNGEGEVRTHDLLARKQKKPQEPARVRAQDLQPD